MFLKATNFIPLVIVASVFLASCKVTVPSRTSELNGNTLSVRCEGKLIDKDSPNTKSPGLITIDNRLYGSDCYKEVITNILEASKNPVVLFVHGRGKHPSKTVEDKLAKNIQDQYGVSVLIFTWPSWDGKSGFPEQQAKQASNELVNLITILDDTKKNGGHDHQLTLLTHSMGAIVLQGVVENGNSHRIQNDTFNNIVISAAAASQKGHKSWVENINFSKRIYVTNNLNDKALLCLEGEPKLICKIGLGFNMPPRLGRVGKGDTGSNTATNASYIDFTHDLGKKHRYYINQKNAANVFGFYNDVLHGKEY